MGKSAFVTELLLFLGFLYSDYFKGDLPNRSVIVYSNELSNAWISLTKHLQERWKKDK